jgi:hypothetical protein
VKWVGVMPYVHQEYADACIASMSNELLDNLLLIDNTKNNIGIMASHNKGIEFMKENDADWLVVISAGIRFGKAGGMDFIEELQYHPDALLVHGAGLWFDKGKEHTARQALGWHLTAFRKEIFDVVGGWDENFTPYGLDDTDLTLRMIKGFPDRYKIEVSDVDMSHTSTSHSITLAGVKSAYAPRESYFKRKWGRDGGEWQSMGYDHPFNDPSLPLSFCPDKDDPRSIWQNEYLTGGYNFDE